MPARSPSSAKSDVVRAQRKQLADLHQMRRGQHQHRHPAIGARDVFGQTLARDMLTHGDLPSRLRQRMVLDLEGHVLVAEVPIPVDPCSLWRSACGPGRPGRKKAFRLSRYLSVLRIHPRFPLAQRSWPRMFACETIVREVTRCEYGSEAPELRPTGAPLG